MPCFHVKRSTTDNQTENNNKYADFIDKLPYDASIEKYKTTILLLIFATFNSFESLKKRNVVDQFVNAESNFDRFHIYINNFIYTKNEQKVFIKDIQKISKLLNKSANKKPELFRRRVMQRFPLVDTKLFTDFKLLQKTVILNPSDKTFNYLCEKLSDILFTVLIDTKEEKGHSF